MMKTITIGGLLVAATGFAGAGRVPERVPPLTVFAAASLTESFKDIGAEFTRRNPGVSIQFSFAGSQQLAAQLEQGAHADVFASADQRWMDYAREHALTSGEPVIFARNRLTIIVPKSNPARINRLQDLARRGVKLVVAGEAVPIGKYSRDMLANLGRLRDFGAGFPARVLANVVSNEETVKGVVTKVQLGEADAGIVYVSDVTADVSRFVTLLEIPEPQNVIASYPISAVRSSENQGGARDFIAFVMSGEGQRILHDHGFLPRSSSP
jgi:molybdate transport system substrate-binding protein